MFFSIILPVYNVEKYLQECIDSILRQTFIDYEVILVDDGSTDQSGTICDKYAAEDPRIKVIHQQNCGQAAARNHGTQAASGEYVVYLDSDDLWASREVLQKLHDRFEQNQALEICAYYYCKYYGETEPPPRPVCSVTVPKNLDFVHKLKFLICNDAFYCSAWSKAIKRELLINGQIHFDGSLACEDMDWYLQLLLHARSIDVIPESFVLYRQRPGSVTKSTGDKAFKDYIFTLNKWRNFLTPASVASIREVLLAALGKLYCNLLISAASDWSQKKKYYPEIKALSSLLHLAWNPRTRFFLTVSRFCGLKGLIMFLNMAGRIRKLKNLSGF